MPYVSAEDAPNSPVADLDRILLDWGSDSQRLPIVASPLCRVVLWQLAPGEQPHPLHRHLQTDELMLVLSGVGVFRVDNGPEFTAGAMSVVYAARGIPHGVRVPGPEPLRWLAIVAPNIDLPDEEVVPIVPAGP